MLYQSGPFEDNLEGERETEAWQWQANALALADVRFCRALL